MIAHGYVLLMMLVYTQVFSLLAMQVAANIVYMKKVAVHRYSTYQLRHQALKVLVDVDKATIVPCNINKMTPAQLTMQNIHWWRSHGCYQNRDGIDYFYVREALDVDGCAAMITQDKQQVAADYYRNTLLQLSAPNHRDILLLQDTIVVPHSVPAVCTLPLKQVKAGRQMLRWM